jgi:hypothetical protein
LGLVYDDVSVLKWGGSIARTRKTRNTYKILVGKPLEPSSYTIVYGNNNNNNNNNNNSNHSVVFSSSLKLVLFYLMEYTKVIRFKAPLFQIKSAVHI